MYSNLFLTFQACPKISMFYIIAYSDAVTYLRAMVFMQLSTVSRLKNDNFVELLGYCLEANNRILVYQFASMGSLHDVLHGKYLGLFFFNFCYPFKMGCCGFHVSVGQILN